MNKKGIKVVVIVSVVTIVAGLGVYVMLSGRSGTGGGAGTGTGSGASSMQYNMEMTGGGMSLSGTVYMKNIGTSNFKIRYDATYSGVDTKVISDSSQNKVWTWTSATGWVETQSADISSYDFSDELAGWTGGDYSVTTGGGTTIRVYNIQMNPTLSDSLFTTA